MLLSTSNNIIPIPIKIYLLLIKSFIFRINFLLIHVSFTWSIIFPAHVEINNVSCTHIELIFMITKSFLFTFLFICVFSPLRFERIVNLLLNYYVIVYFEHILNILLYYFISVYTIFSKDLIINLILTHYIFAFFYFFNY